MLTIISAAFSTLKAKLYAAGAIIAILFYARLKWLNASNEEKTEKIKNLKKEAEVAKDVATIERDKADYYGFQNAIDIHVKDIEKDVESADDRRRFDHAEATSEHDFTNIRV